LKFSHRTNWEFDANQLVTAFNEIKNKKEEIFDLTESNPTHCCFDVKKNRIIKAFDNRENLLYEPG